MPTSVGGVSRSGDVSPLGATLTAAKATNELDRDAFLKLMVAQLKYQNPLSPADPESMLAQSAQFSTVEKLEQLTALLGESSRAERLATGSSLIGKEVIAATGNDGQSVRGVVSGASRTSDGTVLLRVGAYEVDLDAVEQVR